MEPAHDVNDLGDPKARRDTAERAGRRNLRQCRVEDFEPFGLLLDETR